MFDLATRPGIRGVLAAATDRLAAAGIAEPRSEALAIWAGVTGSPWRGRGREDEPAVNPPILATFRQAIRARSAGTPRAYASGVVGFRRLELGADARALIPRPETEGLIDLALDLAPTGHALDLGTGSGCIALSLAQEGTWASVTGVDRSPEALALARENGRRTGLTVRWVEGVWCQPVQGQQFDVVVSNPPYLTTAEVVEADPSVRCWEPAAALDGGADGLDCYRALFATVPAVLAPHGVLVMEIDARRGAETAYQAREAGWTAVTITQDLFGRDRYLSARREAVHD
ncbi:MAG: peptide chain release factor N(5)-glutamine methyltransferase [Gemmatimonadota bacterium]